MIKNAFTSFAEQEEKPEMVAAVFSGLHSLSMEELKFASEVCPELNLLKTKIQARWPRDNKDINPALAHFFLVRDELSIQVGLIRRGEHNFLVPASLHVPLVILAHETHHGLVRTKQRLCKLYWWPKMDTLVHTVIANCLPC